MLAIYTRVSTQEQASKGVSLEHQLNRGISKAKSLGLEWVHFEDAGISGNYDVDKRPGLNKLLEAISQDKITHLYVYDIERLSRGDVLAFYSIKSILIEKNVRLFEDSAETNLKDDSSVLMLNIKQMFGHYERSKRRGTIISNLEDNAKQGKWGGGNRLPYGYKRDSNKMLVIDKVESEWVIKMYQMSIEGNGVRKIAGYLNEKGVKTRTGVTWKDATVWKILNNTIYHGVRKYKDLELTSPAIITKGIYEITRKALEKNVHFTPSKKFDFLLKGLIHCSECNKSFYGRKRDTGKDNQYCCISSRYTKEFCGNRGINIDYLDSVLINSIKDLRKHIEKFYTWFEDNDMIISVMRDIKNFRKKEKELEEKYDNLLNLGGEGIPKEIWNKKISELNEQIEKNKNLKLKYLPQLGILDRKKEILDGVGKLCEGVDSKDFNKRQQIVRSITDKISLLWVPEKNFHLIHIEYKIDGFTDYKLRSDIQIDYKKKGWRMDRVKSTPSLSIQQIGSEVYVNIG